MKIEKYFRLAFAIFIFGGCSNQTYYCSKPSPHIILTDKNMPYIIHIENISEHRVLFSMIQTTT